MVAYPHFLLGAQFCNHWCLFSGEWRNPFVPVGLSDSSLLIARSCAKNNNTTISQLKCREFRSYVLCYAFEMCHCLHNQLREPRYNRVDRVVCGHFSHFDTVVEVAVVMEPPEFKRTLCTPQQPGPGDASPERSSLGFVPAASSLLSSYHLLRG